MRSLFFGLCILGCVTSCFCQDQGTYRLTLGLNYNDQARKQPSFRDKESVPSKLEYWLFTSLSVRVQSALLVSKNQISPGQRATGRGDAVAGGTYTLFDYDKTHPIGFQFDYQVKFPSAVKGLGNDQFEHQVLGIIYRNFLDDRLYGEFDAGALISGRQGKSDTSTPLFSLIETYGLIAKVGDPKSFKWTLFNETDYSPAAAGSATSITGIDQLVYVFSDKWTFRFGPNYAVTPYDSRFGLRRGSKIYRSP